MTLNLSDLNDQIGQMGGVLVDQARQQQRRIDLAFLRLQECADDLDGLRARVAATRTRSTRQETGYSGAYPADEPYGEPLTTRHALPPCPEHAVLIAADGSQILPDRHHILPYYMVNAGAIVFRHGSGEAPAWDVRHKLVYEEDLLFPRPTRELVGAAEVHAERDVLMMETLAQLVRPEDVRPLLALADGPLLLWNYVREAQPRAERREADDIKKFVAALKRIRDADGDAAGYIDRPGNRGVIQLLALAALAPEEITREAQRAAQMVFLGVRDQDVFERVLAPGERSALFVTQSHINKTYREASEGDAEIWFFYLNVTAPAPASTTAPTPHIARVEIPAWVAREQAALERVHALLYAQCQVLGDPFYPYVLVRADELARIDSRDKHEVDRLIEQVLLQRGLRAETSQKKLSKTLTDRRRSTPRRRARRR